MRFYADLHIHSRYSRACSRDCDLEHLAWWAGRKGITVVGTGDFTHPAWSEELRDTLVPAEPGLFRLRPDLERDVLGRLPAACRTPVRFLLSSEISTIYKRDGKTRKVHHLLYAPSLDAAGEITRRLARVGNLASDGRPILGLDSRDLLEITLEGGEDCYLVPAHAWTPWFAVLGSQSGFDRVSDCYADLADHIFALETGLSSDPAMNWRVSSLDGYRLVSNSDAHSPPMLGREATMFTSAVDYFAMRDALRTGEGFGGTVEFFPEEGKYHLDGHRACDVRTSPSETRAAGNVCPVCGKKPTIGVQHRVEALADRPEGYVLEGAADFLSFVQLPEIIGEIAGVGPKSKTVMAQVSAMVERFGPELSILGEVPLDELAERAPSTVTEAIARLRRGEVRRDAGYDGVYGTIRLFDPDELAGAALFDVAAPRKKARRVAAPAPDPEPAPGAALPDGLDDEQRRIVEHDGGPLLVIAGPGAGKTRVLIHALEHRLRGGLAPERCLAITFTRRARDELASRLAALVPDAAPKVTIATFHGLGLLILREQCKRIGLDAGLKVADEPTKLAVLRQLPGGDKAASLASRISEAKLSGAEDPVKAQYDAALRERGLVDTDDLLTLPLRLLEEDAELASSYRSRWSDVFVDEYQDVDDLQYRLLRTLTSATSRVAAIGDPDQAIYGFRGGDVGYFLRFQSDFPEAATARLERSYRSAPTIVRAALQLIRPGTLVPGRELIPARTDIPDAPVMLRRVADERAEAEEIASSIERFLGGASFHALDSRAVDGRVRTEHQLSFSDFAVLYRTSAQAAAVGEALARRGFPFQRRSHERLSEMAGVPQILAALAAPVLDSGGVAAALTSAVATATETAADAETRAVIRTAAEVLAPLAARSGDDLDRFLDELSLGAEVDTWDPRADRISLLTLHASKGLEFPVVFIAGCDDGLLPLRMFDTDYAEERRLFFVGMTRATTRLILLSAASRVLRGTVTECAPSPFLASIEPELLDRHEEGARRGKRRGGQQLTLL
ncbi:MAG: UvrD-helicase domain-containing protein [Streptosporangiaceae bacterium]